STELPLFELIYTVPNIEGSPHAETPHRRGRVCALSVSDYTMPFMGERICTAHNHQQSQRSRHRPARRRRSRRADHSREPAQRPAIHHDQWIEGRMDCALAADSRLRSHYLRSGIQDPKSPDIKIDPGVPATLNVTLELGSVSETVEVQGGTE